jgi:hypothetical protein
MTGSNGNGRSLSRRLRPRGLPGPGVLRYVVGNPKFLVRAAAEAVRGGTQARATTSARPDGRVGPPAVSQVR